MSPDSLVAAYRLLEQAVDAVVAESGPLAGDAELLSALTLAEGVERRLQRLSVDTIADLQRRGTFAKKGYTSTAKALTDLLGWEWSDARRRLTVAEQVCPRIGLNGTVLPARLTATAKVYASGGCSLRQVEVIARALNSDAARRLDPERWAGAEEQLAAIAGDFSPPDLHTLATSMIERLDQDGPEPDDDQPLGQVNEVFLTRNPNGIGGKIKGRIDDPAMYDAIATVLDTHTTPRTADDDRPLGQRQAEALADVCGYVLDHGDLPDSGGERPHLNVLVRLEDLQNRARAGCLDFGGQLPAETLRMLCCDAKVVPSSWAAKANHSTSAAPPASSPTGCGAPSPPEIAAAHAAEDHPAGAKFTTFNRGNATATRVSRTARCCVGVVIAWSTTAAGTYG